MCSLTLNWPKFKQKLTLIRSVWLGESHIFRPLKLKRAIQCRGCICVCMCVWVADAIAIVCFSFSRILFLLKYQHMDRSTHKHTQCVCISDVAYNAEWYIRLSPKRISRVRKILMRDALNYRLFNFSERTLGAKIEYHCRAQH